MEGPFTQRTALFACQRAGVMPLYRYNVTKQLGIATLALEKDGFSLEPSLKYDVQTQHAQPILAISQKKGADTLKAAYDIEGEMGTLEWIRNPYKVCISSFLPFAFCSRFFMQAHPQRHKTDNAHQRPTQYASFGKQSLLDVATGQTVRQVVADRAHVWLPKMHYG